MKPFRDYLKNIEYPKKKCSWEIAGTLNNGFYKFDTRPLKNNVKVGSFKTKADKIVIDKKDQYIILDVDELHCYLKENKLMKVMIEDLVLKLNWNIILPRNKES